MSGRVEVIFNQTSGEGGYFKRYYSRDVVALLTKGDVVYLDDVPWGVGYYEIVRRVIQFDPSAERLETVKLFLTSRGHFFPALADDLP